MEAKQTYEIYMRDNYTKTYCSYTLCESMGFNGEATCCYNAMDLGDHAMACCGKITNFADVSSKGNDPQSIMPCQW